MGNLGTVEYLVKHGEDVEGVDSAGRSALHAAVEGGQVDAIQLLVVDLSAAPGGRYTLNPKL